MKQEWRKIIDVHPVVLYKNDLIELLQILTACEPPQKVDLSVQFGYEGLKQTFNTIDEIKEFIRDDPTNEFSVNVQVRDENQKIINGLVLSMYHNFINYQIYSENEAWFLGRTAQLTNFFRKRKPWYSVLNRAIPFSGPLLTIGGLLFGIFALKTGNVLSSLSAFCFTILMTIIMVFSYKGKLFPYVRIHPYDKRKRALTYEVVSLLIAILTLLATVIGSILLPIFSTATKK